MRAPLPVLDRRRPRDGDLSSSSEDDDEVILLTCTRPEDMMSTWASLLLGVCFTCVMRLHERLDYDSIALKDASTRVPEVLRAANRVAEIYACNALSYDVNRANSCRGPVALEKGLQRRSRTL